MREPNELFAREPVKRGLPVDPDHDCWRDGRYLVMQQDARLPNRCVCCNAATDSKLSITATTGGQRSRVMAVVYLFQTLVNDRIVSRYATRGVLTKLPRSTNDMDSRVRVGLCHEHLRTGDRRKFVGRMSSVLGAVMLPVAVISALASGVLFFLLAFTSLMLFGASWLLARSRTGCHKVDGRFVWINGVCEEYLEQLPQWTPR